LIYYIEFLLFGENYMLLNGSQILIECLIEQGVDTIFGYPGGSVLNIYDELYNSRSRITHILTAHEQGAAHAADGYARVTGKVGVCLATSGPGATNLVTGIATAYMDSVPIVAITGNVTLPLLGKDSFQEVDIAGITMPITKYSFIVKDVNKLADTVRRAFLIARSGRPGPVLVDITKDVTADKCEYEPEIPGQPRQMSKQASDADISAAAAMIMASKQPMICVGGGAVISAADAQIKMLADLIDAPVADTLMGKGAFDGNDDRYTGMIGMHGTKASNLSTTACDLFIAIGMRFSDRVTGNVSRFAPHAQILQIDIDPAEINKNVTVDHVLIGDVKDLLIKLSGKLMKLDHSEWMDKVTHIKDEYPISYPIGRLTGPYIIEKLCELTKGDAIIVTEVGQHQMWGAQFYKYPCSRRFITSGGLGTMGFGLGASIGAKIAFPDKTVVNLAGDGCLRMNMNELATAARNNIHIIEIVFDNHVLGMVHQWQTLFYGKRYSQTVLEDSVDFIKLAEALGCVGIKLTEKSQVESVLKKALSCEKPVLIDARIDSNDMVWPMVAPGGAIEDCFDDSDMDYPKETE
jgi:acetolactate synthase-1/2/3 large subunit